MWSRFSWRIILNWCVLPLYKRIRRHSDNDLIRMSIKHVGRRTNKICQIFERLRLLGLISKMGRCFVFKRSPNCKSGMQWDNEGKFFLFMHQQLRACITTVCLSFFTGSKWYCSVVNTSIFELVASNKRCSVSDSYLWLSSKLMWGRVHLYSW